MSVSYKKWNVQYEQLVEFKRTNGHCMVPYTYEQDKSLGHWVSKQRTQYNNNKLLLDRNRLLEDLGFAWKDDGAYTFNLTDKIWHQQYEKLVEFKRRRGHCIVPSEYEQDKPFGQWAATQRRFHIKNKMRPERKELLDKIGFPWKTHALALAARSKAFTSMTSMTKKDKLWHQQYEQLLAFKEKNGHSIVPHRYEQDKSLGKWVNSQRQIHAKHAMKQDRRDLLDELGFVWRVHDEWNEQYDKLVEFERKNGHCMVPRMKNKRGDASLATWVATQRINLKNNKIRVVRKTLLDQIGFAWKVDDDHTFKPDDRLWQQQYEQLVEFKRKNGHCVVPSRYEQAKVLVHWVSHQRKNHDNNKMRQDRKDLLDKIDFFCEAGSIATRTSAPDNSDSEEFTSSVGLPHGHPHEAPEETEAGQDRVRNRLKGPSPSRKRPRTCLAEEGGRMAARTNKRNQRGDATGSCSSVETDGGRDEEDSKPSLVKSSVLIGGSYPGQEAVQEDAPTPDEIPSGWARVKLEPDC